MNINWNDNNSTTFNPTRGLQQGDPISSFLFVLYMEHLAHKIQDFVANGKWKPFSFGIYDNVQVSFLFFVDDLILVAEPSIDQARKINDILNVLYHVSGQRVNLNKSFVFFSKKVNSVTTSKINIELNIPISMDFKSYLGFLFLHHKKSPNQFNFLVEKVKSKLTAWKACNLSMVGRITLAQSSLISIMLGSKIK